MSLDNREKYDAIMLLHALGDTLGFKNGDWEFNYYDRSKLEVLDYVNEMIYEFIDLGGVNGIDLSDWKVSDDTFLHIAVAKTMLKYDKKINERLMDKMKDYIYEEAMKMLEEVKKKKFNRYIGVTTFENIKKFKDGKDARDGQYNNSGGGNGAAMRNLVIGMCLYGEDNRSDLADISVLGSQLTHNNSIGFLAGFNSAFFTALAMENVPVKKWPYLLIDYLRSDKMREYLSVKNLDQVYDFNRYIRYWQKYIDTKFDENGENIKSKANANPMHRIRYFHDNFYKGTPSDQIGSSGYLCMIMAYDAVLDCDGKWEKLIFYAILHSGDSDTIGAIAGGLYGAVYGFGDVPKSMIKHIERKKELLSLSEKLYNKYESK